AALVALLIRQPKAVLVQLAGAISIAGSQGDFGSGLQCEVHGPQIARLVQIGCALEEERLGMTVVATEGRDIGQRHLSDARARTLAQLAIVGQGLLQERDGASVVTLPGSREAAAQTRRRARRRTQLRFARQKLV